MLLAEIHGKIVPEARESEDYLTSAVFSHLRYIPPRIFWEELFRLAKMSTPNKRESNLAAVVAQAICPISNYRSLMVHFWRNHPNWGEPDLLLVFSGERVRPLVVLVEAKLWSGKSGVGECDQLVRYLRLLDDLLPLRLGLAADPYCCLVYLTARDPSAEIEDSLAQPHCQAADRLRIFGLRWQDVVLAAANTFGMAEEPSKTILLDMMRFLKRLGLEYFDGFRMIDSLPLINAKPLTLEGTRFRR